MPELKMPARLDEQDALDLTIKLWEWVAKTGSNRKEDWPGWAKIPFTFKFFCPLCQYVGDTRRQTCIVKCPWGRWKGIPCTDYPNPPPTNYSAWADAASADPSVRMAYARSFLAELKEVRKEIAR